eukprot:600199-Pleurochrysis_carterae.AAC.1
MAFGPMLDALGTDYLFILSDNVVRIVSLGSGTQIHAIRPLGDLASPMLESIAVAGDGRHFAVGCSERQQVWLYEITTPSRDDEARKAVRRVRAGSMRYRAVSAEQSVKDFEPWRLGHDSHGYNGVHAEAFMRRTVLAVVEAAMEARVDSTGAATGNSAPGRPRRPSRAEVNGGRSSSRDDHKSPRSLAVAFDADASARSQSALATGR